MSTTRRLWIPLGLLLGVTFTVLLGMGREIHRSAPTLPGKVVTTSGQTLFTHADLETARQVWQSFGGQQLGAVWGHGSLFAADWVAISNVGALLYAWFVLRLWIAPKRVLAALDVGHAMPVRAVGAPARG